MNKGVSLQKLLSLVHKFQKEAIYINDKNVLAVLDTRLLNKDDSADIDSFLYLHLPVELYSLLYKNELTFYKSHCPFTKTSSIVKLVPDIVCFYVDCLSLCWIDENNKLNRGQNLPARIVVNYTFPMIKSLEWFKNGLLCRPEPYPQKVCFQDKVNTLLYYYENNDPFIVQTEFDDYVLQVFSD